MLMGQHKFGRSVGRPEKPAPQSSTGASIEKISAPVLYQERATPAGYGPRLKLAIECCWLWMHEAARSCGSRRPAPNCRLKKYWRTQITNARGIAPATT
jgi:hypothetical protein